MMDYLKTLKILKKQKSRLILPTVIDIIAVVVLLLVYYFFFLKMMPSMMAIAEIATDDMSAAIESLSVQEPGPIGEVMPELRKHYAFLMKNLVLMLLSFLAICILTQPFSWHRLHILFRKVKFKTYAKSFALISAAYYLIFLISAPLFFNLLYLFSRILGTPIRPFFNSIMLVLFFLVSYLAVTSYSLIGVKNLVKKSFRKAFSWYALRFFSAAAGILAVIFIFFTIATFITSPAIQSLIMLFVIPFITLAKLWLLE